MFRLQCEALSPPTSSDILVTKHKENTYVCQNERDVTWRDVDKNKPARLWINPYTTLIRRWQCLYKPSIYVYSTYNHNHSEWFIQIFLRGRDDRRTHLLGGLRTGGRGAWLRQWGGSHGLRAHEGGPRGAPGRTEPLLHQSAQRPDHLLRRSSGET